MATALAAAAREEVPLHNSLANHVLAAAEMKALKVLTFALFIEVKVCVSTCNYNPPPPCRAVLLIQWA